MSTAMFLIGTPAAEARSWSSLSETSSLKFSSAFFFSTSSCLVKSRTKVFSLFSAALIWQASSTMMTTRWNITVM